MLVLYWMLIVLVGFAFILLMPSVIGLTIYQRYRGTRKVTCPEVRGRAFVKIDAVYAALTGMAATEQLRLANCSLWPQHGGCAEQCIDEARDALAQSEPKRNHQWFPVHFPSWLTASAVFWVLGMFWYSDRYLFRNRWMLLSGYDPEIVHHLVRTWTPHLLTCAIALICTLGIAWAIEIFDRHTLKSGVGIGLLFGLIISIAITFVVLRSGCSPSLISIHAGYALLACTAAGAILGAWKPGSILRWLDQE